uniref:Uncharacterized protein n=1 Tax=Peronospora matthiolae TaxID=2874970 RepID=A0AAV1TI11_9STRA
MSAELDGNHSKNALRRRSGPASSHIEAGRRRQKERLICIAIQARLVSDPPDDGISVGLLERMNGVGLAAEGSLSIPQIRDRGHRETNVVGRNSGNEAGDAHSWSRPFTRFISGRDVGSGRIWGRRRSGKREWLGGTI